MLQPKEDSHCSSRGERRKFEREEALIAEVAPLDGQNSCSYGGEQTSVVQRWVCAGGQSPLFSPIREISSTDSFM